MKKDVVKLILTILRYIITFVLGALNGDLIVNAV